MGTGMRSKSEVRSCRICRLQRRWTSILRCLKLIVLFRLRKGLLVLHTREVKGILAFWAANSKGLDEFHAVLSQPENMCGLQYLMRACLLREDCGGFKWGELSSGFWFIRQSFSCYLGFWFHKTYMFRLCLFQTG